MILDLNRDAQTRIAELRKLAERRPLSVGEVDDQIRRARRGETVRLPTGLTIDVPGGFRVGFAVEQSPRGRRRHLTIVQRGAAVPDITAVLALMREFGMPWGRWADSGLANSADASAMWLQPPVLNVLQAIEGELALVVPVVAPDLPDAPIRPVTKDGDELEDEGGEDP